MGLDAGEARTRDPADAGSTPATSIEEPAPERRKRKKKKLPKIISSSEADRLLGAAGADRRVSSDERLRNRLALEFMYRAGLRVSEVCKIAVRDVERDGIIRLYDAKGGDGTSYFAVDDVLPLLDRWLVIRERWLASRVGGYAVEAPLFVMPSGGSMNSRYLQRLVKRLKEQVAITGICTPHVLRHSFATELLEEGLTIAEVQRAMRHANLATTAVYLHVRDEPLRRKISRRGRHDEGREEE